MKTKFFILFLLLSAWQANAQNTKEPYIPILTDSLKWWSAFVYEYGIECYEKSVEETQVYNDTLYYRQAGAWFVEDTTLRRVYTMSSSNFEIATRHLMYDFSLNEGDSLWHTNYTGGHYWFFVDSIRIINTYVGPRKTWYLHFDQGWIEHPVWVEGIGSLAGFRIYNTTPGLLYWGQGLLTCFYQGGTLIYEHVLAQQYDCALTGYLYTETKEQNINLIFYPNPADRKGKIKFKNPEHVKVKLEIYDCYGRKLYHDQSTADEFTFHTQNFPQGIYFYVLSADNQIFYKSKFIVKH